ncbi:MAG: hypothetical protein RLZZ32_917 [Cyanobacteriota bacterium]
MSLTGGSLRGVASPSPQLWLLSLESSEPSRLSAQEEQWCAGLPARLQLRYRSSRSQLRARVAQVLGCEPEAVALHSPPGQPPRLVADQGYVSISHSAEALLLAWSPAPIGIDLERWDRPLQAEPLARRFFPAQEVKDLLALPPEQRSARFLESWVCKEAAIKWSASSIAADLSHWLWNHDRKELWHLEQDWKPECAWHVREGWCCAAVGDGVASAQWR